MKGLVPANSLPVPRFGWPAIGAKPGPLAICRPAFTKIVRAPACRTFEPAFRKLPDRSRMSLVAGWPSTPRNSGESRKMALSKSHPAGTASRVTHSSTIFSP